MVAHPFMPPPWFGGVVNDIPSPCGSREAATLRAVEQHFALVGVEVGDHAQAQALSRAGRAGDRQTFACRQLQIEGSRQPTTQVDNTQAGSRRGHTPFAYGRGGGGGGRAAVSSSLNSPASEFGEQPNMRADS